MIHMIHFWVRDWVQGCPHPILKFSYLLRSEAVALNVLIEFFALDINHLSLNPTKWSNILKQFVGSSPTICLSVFEHFVGLALNGLSFVLLVANQTCIGTL